MSQGSGIVERKKIHPNRMERSFLVVPLNSDISHNISRAKSVGDIVGLFKGADIKVNEMTLRTIQSTSYPKEEEARVWLGILPLEKFGFVENEHFLEFCRRTKESFELHDVSPRLSAVSRMNYPNQPCNERVYIVMEPISVDGKQTVFVLETSKSGDNMFSSVNVDEIMLQRDTLVLFRLPKSG